MALFSLPAEFPTIRTEDLLQASNFFKPASTADILALATISVVSAGYFLKGIAWDKPNPHYHKFFERPQLIDSEANSQKKETRNIAQKLEEHGKNLVIFWGSQSGTSEGFANRLGRECHLRFGIEVLVADLSDYDPETIALIPETKFAIFIISTYGEGDPSDNTADLWAWIHKTKDVSLSSLRYAALGLGNSNYKYYNQVIDVVADFLNKSGAKCLMAVGKADDAQGATEEDFIQWKEDLFSVFQHDLDFKQKEIQYTPTFSVIEDGSLAPIDIHHGEPTHARERVKVAAPCSAIRPLGIKKSRELFSSSQRNCLHIDLEISDHPDLHYKTGDHIGVWPMNPDEEIDRLLEALGRSTQRDVPITIKSLDPESKIMIPTPTTTATLFRHYLEICAPVSRENMLNLAQFAPSPDAKAYLTTLGQDKTLYTNFVARNYLTIGRVLRVASPNLPWSDLPLSYLIETLPRLQPRYYSISSSPIVSPRHPSITALISKTTLANAPTQTVYGLTTNYLLSLSNSLNLSPPQSNDLTYHLNGPCDSLQGGKIFAHLRKSKFKLPALTSCPLIMISAGTGLAPFMAFLAERKKLLEIGKTPGEMVLFFGCRHPDEDYIYRDELAELETAFAGKLRIVTAFSRLPGCRRMLVQDRVGEFSHDVLRLMEEGAGVYICGRANMAKEVERTVGEAVKAKMGWDNAQLGDWSRSIKGMRKWQEDVWG